MKTFDIIDHRRSLSNFTLISLHKKAQWHIDNQFNRGIDCNLIILPCWHLLTHRILGLMHASLDIDELVSMLIRLHFLVQFNE